MTEPTLTPVPLLETGGMVNQGRDWLKIDLKMGYDINNDCSHAEAKYAYGKESESYYTGTLTRALERGWVSNQDIPETPYQTIIDDFIERVTNPNVTITDIPQEQNETFKTIFKSLMTELRDHQTEVINQSIRLDLYDWGCQSKTLKTFN